MPQPIDKLIIYQGAVLVEGEEGDAWFADHEGRRALHLNGGSVAPEEGDCLQIIDLVNHTSESYNIGLEEMPFDIVLVTEEPSEVN